MGESIRTTVEAETSREPAAATARQARAAPEGGVAVGNQQLGQLARGGVGLGAGLAGAPLGNLTVQRACCASCNCDEEPVQRAADGGGGVPREARVRSLVDRATRGGGQPLDGAVREEMETRLGRSLADVRLHSGPEAAVSAKALQAHAFTVGNDVVLGNGQRDRDRILAHELAHVAQQRDGLATSKLVSEPGDPAEREAEEFAAGGAGPVRAAPGAHIHREGGEGGAGGGVPYSTGAGGGPGSGGEPQPEYPDEDTGSDDSAPPEFDPCSVNVAKLTNAELLAQFVAADSYIRDPEHLHRDQYYDYLWLRRRTGQERQARATAGESWLADNITSVPGALFRLEPGPNTSVLIVAEPGEAAAGAPRTFTDTSVVTQGQLDGYLKKNHVSQGKLDEVLADPEKPHLVDVLTAQMVWAQKQPQQGRDRDPMAAPGLGGMLGTWPIGRTADPMSLAVHEGFKIGYDLNYNSVLKYQGAAGEYAYPVIDPAGGGFIDLNRTSGNALDYDFIDPSVRSLIQVKTSEADPTYTTKSGDTKLSGTYEKGLESIWGHPSEPAKANRWRSNLDLLSQQSGLYLGPRVAMARGKLVINSDHVDAVRPVVADMVASDPSTLAEVYRAMLWDKVIEYNGKQYTVNDFNRDLKAGTVPAEVTKAVGKAASENIVGGLSTEQVTGVSDLLSSKVNSNTSPREAALGTRPLEIQGALGGFSPGTRAAGMGAAGNILGGLTVMALSRIKAKATGQAFNSDVGEEARNIALSTPFAAGASALELRLQDMAMQQAIRGGAESVPFYLRPGALKFGLPVLTAPAITMATMGMSSHTYPWQEYAVQGTRAAGNAAAAAGFLAVVGAFATSGAEGGAVAGSVEPGGGTAVGGLAGFVGGVIVGSIAYFVADITVGDLFEKGARSLVGEPEGCGGKK